MSHNTTNRPRMAATYAPDTVRAAMATCAATARLAAGQPAPT